ncbi:hypothetical protein D3C76_1832560 [compost metagenome]
MLVVQVIEDHPAVMQDVTISQAQGRDLAGGVVFVQGADRADRAQGDGVDGNTVQLPGFVQQDHDFADEG